MMSSIVFNSSFKITKIRGFIFPPNQQGGKGRGDTWWMQSLHGWGSWGPDTCWGASLLSVCGHVGTKAPCLQLLLLPRYQRALLSVKSHHCGHYTTPTFCFLYWILVKGNNVFENNISIFRIWRLHKTGAGDIRHRNESSFLLRVLGSFWMTLSWGRWLGDFSGGSVWGEGN